MYVYSGGGSTYTLAGRTSRKPEPREHLLPNTRRHYAVIFTKSPQRSRDASAVVRDQLIAVPKTEKLAYTTINARKLRQATGAGRGWCIRMQRPHWLGQVTWRTSLRFRSISRAKSFRFDRSLARPSPFVLSTRRAHRVQCSSTRKARNSDSVPFNYNRLITTENREKCKRTPTLVVGRSWSCVHDVCSWKKQGTRARVNSVLLFWTRYIQWHQPHQLVRREI